MKLSELKGPPPPVRSLPVTDSGMTQRVGGACEEEQEAEEEVALSVRRRTRKSLAVVAAADVGEMKVRGRRQRDFDPAVVEEEEAEPQECGEKADPAAWTQNQQKLLELALQQFPRGTAERWDRIAKVVPGKSKVRTNRQVYSLPVYLSVYLFTCLPVYLSVYLTVSLIKPVEEQSRNTPVV